MATYFHEGDSRHIEQSVKEFCQDVVRKDYGKFVKAKQFSREVFKQMGERGFLGAMVPEEYGGAGMNMQQYVVLMESLACYGGGSIALTLTAHHSLAIAHILYAGTEEQKKAFLPKLAKGETIGAWCLTEPDAGSDAFGIGMKTTATTTGSGRLINGSKQFITNGTIADIFVVIAKTFSNKHGQQNYGAFIVPKASEGRFICSAETNKVGMDASDTSTVIFENVEVGINAEMEGDGRASTYKVLNSGRVGISALACGLLRSALKEAVNYGKIRKTFGKPISEYQAVSHRLADVSATLTACWAMVEKSAHIFDKGELTIQLASETKLHVTEKVLSGCLDAARTFGGNAYIKDNRIAQDLMDAILLIIGEGTSDMQRLAVAKSLFK
ncbi:MAG: acyl-CoA dehydrogenase family protein [Candidatus Yanofskybacteria bacterium]|nr:acyl-CoA dehydrogenase family protein [Candidatus Yanofskybacteria bacterium]